MSKLGCSAGLAGLGCGRRGKDAAGMTDYYPNILPPAAWVRKEGGREEEGGQGQKQDQGWSRLHAAAFSPSRAYDRAV